MNFCLILYYILYQQYYQNIMGRPQNQLPPDLYYNTSQASKYESNTRIQLIQTQMTERCIQLLNLQSPALILDVGCGSSLSGQILTQNGFCWQGIDISRDMLQLAASKKVEGGLLQVDMGQGHKVRPGTFDGVISVSALQWLCVASRKNDNPFKRCCRFFQYLYESMVMGGRAVFQFYPDGKHQLQMITTSAMKAGFSGGLVIDYPNSTKAKKYYLVVEAGGNKNLGIQQIKGKSQQDLQQQEENEEAVVKNVKEKKKVIFKRKSTKTKFKTRDWIIKKKDRHENKGIKVRPTTKYTGRKRRNRGF